jgi:hypothetical protein
MSQSLYKVCTQKTRTDLGCHVAQVSGQDELFGAQPAVTVDVGKAPDLGQNVLGQSSLKQQVACLKFGEKT